MSDDAPDRTAEDVAKAVPPRGVIRLTDRARHQIAWFIEDQRKSDRFKDWVAVLIWGPVATKSREADDWTELGDAWTLTFYERAVIADVPLEITDGVDYFLMFDARGWEEHRGKVIDHDGSKFVFAKT